MATLTQVDTFIYRATSVHNDWPLYNQRLETFLRIQKVPYTIAIADPNSNPPVIAETTSRALDHLLHSGGEKILSIFNTTPQNTNLHYVTFVDVLNTRFAAQNTTIADFIFRGTTQNINENLDDHVTRLRGLAIAANIQKENRDNEILRVIRQNTTEDETKHKCFDDQITLTILLSWRKTLDAKNIILARQTPKPENVLAISSQSQIGSKKCNFCAGSWPHQKGTTCPAKGKQCSKCGRYNHFAVARRDGQPLKNTRSTTNQNQRNNLNQYIR